MFLLLRHRLALSSLAFAALTACGGGSSDPATPAAEATATETAALTCIQPAYPSTGYSQVFKGCDAANVATYYAKDECVRDNVSGLIWQGQTPAGTSFRANDLFQTNFDSTTELQKRVSVSGETLFISPNAAEVNNRFNSIGFKNVVNASNLCGSGAWRLPTKDELLGIVKINGTVPTIDTDWFPNTPKKGYYWSASPYADYAYAAWYVYFGNGGAYGGVRDGRDGGAHPLVRLVR